MNQVTPQPAAIAANPASKRAPVACFLNRTAWAEMRFNASSRPISLPPGNQNPGPDGLGSSGVGAAGWVMLFSPCITERHSRPKEEISSEFAGISGTNDGGKKIENGIQANQQRKYWPITSQMSLSTWANVPARIRKIDSANNATVSRSDAAGSIIRLTMSQTFRPCGSC